MPSPLAHIGAALAIRHLARPGAWPIDRVGIAACAAALAPDLDMLLVLALPGGLAWHHGPSHSLVGAGLIAGFTCWIGRIRNPSSVLVVGIAGLSHVLLDGFTGDPSEAARFGVPWAWPFSAEKWISSHPFFVPFGIDGDGFLWRMVHGAGRAYGVEGAFVAVCWGVALTARALLPGGQPMPSERSGFPTDAAG